MESAISIRDLSFSFDGDSLVLSNVSLEIFQGELVGLMGSSGCGKTTLLNLIAGILEPDSGGIQMFSGDAEGMAAVAYVPQGAALVGHKTVLENVRIPLELANSSQKLDSGRAKTEFCLNTLPLVGLKEPGVAQKLGRELSGGMAQRVAWARALTTGAPFWLLDEPFSALDDFTVSHLVQTLNARRGEIRAGVLSSHRLEHCALACDRLVLLGGRPTSVIGSWNLSSLRQNTEESMEFAAQYFQLKQEIRTRIQNASAKIS